ncbi:MAG: AAA family ATPase [Candidatus Woesearchaeota archaeon]|nr:MAG: AAA family ATPase [Candidatus Woesearchaeota archaeon]
MEKKVLGITGMASAGKDTVGNYLKEKYNFEVLSFSDILIEEAKKKKIEPTKMNLSKIGDDYRKKHGMGGLAIKILNKINKSKKDKIVITNFRSPEEVDYIRNHVDDFTLVEIRTDPELRWKRRRKEDPQTEEEFFERDKRDKELKGLGKVIELADKVIENNSDFKDLYKYIDEFMK